MKLCLLATCLLVGIVTVSAGSGGGGGKGKGKGPMKHLKKWKMCGEKPAEYDGLKAQWEECKAENPKPEENEGADGEGGEESGDKPKKHEHMKKLHDCITKKMGIIKDDGSFDDQKVKEVIIGLYGNEIGTKLGDKIISDCAEKMAAAKEGEGKWKVMKCCGKAHKEVCGEKEDE